jgi:hypothetical protein
MKIGSTNRVPNTAMRMPHVRNLLCHRGLICSRIFAFTTALSNESVVSRTARIETRKNAEKPAKKPTPPRSTNATSMGRKKKCEVIAFI